MRTVSFASPLSEVLCLGAHCDDVEIGCGGLLATLAASRPALRIRVVTFVSDPARARESRDALTALLPPGANLEAEYFEFRDGYLPAHWAEAKSRIESVARSGEPDLVLTHCAEDRHQDHALISQLTWTAFRNHFVLEYEIPKFDGDLGKPALFFPLTEAIVARKVSALMSSFASQRHKPWFTEDAFRALMRLRGMECNASSGHAEAFHCRKVLLEP